MKESLLVLWLLSLIGIAYLFLTITPPGEVTLEEYAPADNDRLYGGTCPNLLATAGNPLDLAKLNIRRPNENYGPVAMTRDIGFVSSVGSGPVPGNFSSEWPTGPSPDTTTPGLAHSVPTSVLTESATHAANRAVEAATPQPQGYSIPAPLPPGRTWRPTWEGVGSAFVDSSCAFFSDDQRLFATDLDDLIYRRSLLDGVSNTVEPLSARQSQIQFLTMDLANRKDKYTQNYAANDLGASKCVSLKRNGPPRYVGSTTL